MSSITFNRPVDKTLLDPATSRIVLEWDNFFNLTAKYIQNTLAQTTFTMAGASSKVISDARVRSGSFVGLTPINASAGTLQGSAGHLYVDASVLVPGVSFTVKTADGSSAAGTEQFAYVIIG
jgi:hypothetical protein